MRVGKTKDKPGDIPQPTSITPATQAGVVASLRDAIADPLDTRSPEEIGSSLGLTLKQVRAIVQGKKFSQDTLQAFKENLPASAPMIFKSLMKQAQSGSTSASKIYLEAVGFLKGDGGNHLHLHNHSSTSSGFDYSSLTDEELDKDIARLLSEISPGDLKVTGGQVLPAEYEIMSEANSGMNNED